MVKRIISVVAGIIVGTVVVFLLELPGNIMYPLPEGVGLDDTEAMGEHIANLPFFPKLMVVLAYALGAFAGGLVSAKLDVAHWKSHAVIVGLMIALGAMMTAQQFPHPTWMLGAGLLLPIPLAYLGAQAVAKNNEPAA